MRIAVAALAVAATLGSGCYFGATPGNRRNATIVNAAIVLVGAAYVVSERDAMERLPTSADSGAEIQGTTRMLAGAIAMAAGIAGIVLNVTAESEPPRGTPLTPLATATYPGTPPPR